MKISLLSDLEWDQELQKSPYGAMFHTSFWKNQVTACLGGVGKLYQYSTEQDVWLMPVYIGAPWSKSGFHVGSVGYGGPIPLKHIHDPKLALEGMREAVFALEQKILIKCTGIRTFPCSSWQLLQPVSGQSLSNSQIIPLQESLEVVFNTVLTGNVRTAIRRADQNNLMAYQIQDETEQELAYELLTETQKRVCASYVTPKELLLGLVQHKDISLFGIKSDGKLIGMALLLIYEKKAMHLFHGWKRDSNIPGSNQLLIWEMIKKSIEEGCDSFNMGESHSQELLTAKKRWGCVEVPILTMKFEK